MNAVLGRSPTDFQSESEDDLLDAAGIGTDGEESPDEDDRYEFPSDNDEKR